MSFSLPNPTSPTNGQPLDATPILANSVAIQQAIDSFDGSQIQAKSVTEQALADAINPQLRDADIVDNFVKSGCVWSATSGLAASMTGGTIYVNGYRVIVSGIGSETFPASSDTYVYIDYLGNVTYQSVSNNSSSPTATANAILIAIVVTGGSTIGFVNQGQLDTTLSGFAPVVTSISLTCTDTQGNLIYPQDPTSRLLGYRQITSDFNTATLAAITGLNVICIVPSGRNVRVTAYIGAGSASVASNALYMNIVDITNSNTLLTDAVGTTNASGDVTMVSPSRVYKPSATTMNWKSELNHGSNAATVHTNSSSTNPSYIMVELE